MNKMKVLTLLVLCFILVFSLAACGNNEKAENANVNDPAPVVEEEPAVVEEEPAEAAPVDLGGRIVKISAWWDLTPAGETAGDKARLERIAELEKKYNMKIEFVNVPWDQYVEKFTTTVLAGEPFADIVRMEVKWALPAILNKQLLPLSEFTTSFNDINNEAKLIQKLSPVGGGEYGFAPPAVGGGGIHYNKDIFKNLGLPDLHELQASGQWNWEKFLEVAKLATKDTDNDGKTDVWGYSGWPAQLVRHLAVNNGVKVADDATGQQTLTDPRVIETVEFVNRMYNVDKVVYNKSGKLSEWTERDVFIDGKSAMFAANEWQMADVPFDFGVVPFPVGPTANPDYTWADDGAHAYFIPKGVKDAPILYQIFEEMEMIPPLEDYPGQDYLESRYKTQEDIDMMREHVVGKGLVVLDGAYPDYPFSAFVDEVIDMNVSVTATAEKVKQQAQDAIDKLGK